VGNILQRRNSHSLSSSPLCMISKLLGSL
jgi:hypothetical protein